MARWMVELPQDYKQNDDKSCLDCKHFGCSTYSDWRCYKEDSGYDLRQRGSFRLGCEHWEIAPTQPGFWARAFRADRWIPAKQEDVDRLLQKAERFE